MGIFLRITGFIGCLFTAFVFCIAFEALFYYRNLEKAEWHCTNYDYTSDTCIQYSKREGK